MNEYSVLREHIPILNLNSYCINEIFLKIKKNCASSNIEDDLLKYSDLINFAISCEKFTNAFREWSPDLYKKLCIENTFLSISPGIEIDLSHVYAHMHSLSINENKLFWSRFVHQIKENEKLESVKLTYEPTRFYPEHFDKFQDIIKCLKNKDKLRELSVKLKAYTFDPVPQINNLEILHIDARIDAHILVQLCALNPNLQRLTLSEVCGRLSYIVPHCNRLEHLTIAMKQGVDAAEYEALAKLPRLNELILLGDHQEGSLLKLFQGLKKTRVQKICIPETYVSNEEVFALASILHLISLKCCFRNQTIFENFPLRESITDLRLMARPNKHVTEFENGQEIGHFRVTHRIKVGQAANEGNANIFGGLSLQFDALLKELFSYTRIRGEGIYNTSSLLKIMHTSPETRIVEEIVLDKYCQISEEDISIMASVPTLTTIRCSFLQIKQMIAVKLKQLEAITETENRVDRIRTEYCEIRLVHGQESVTLILDFFGKCFENYAKLFAPLANLRNIKRLEIKGNFKWGSLVELLKGLTSLETHTLEELEAVFLDPEELEEVVKLRSLKILKSGFFCSKNIDKLIKLNQLEVLILTVHPQGSLEKLFKLLASKKLQVLKSLVIERTKLTSQEVVELAGLRSLETLQLGFPEIKDWEQPLINKTENLEVEFCQKCRLPTSSSIYVEHQTHVHTLSSVPHKEALTAQYNFLTQLYGNFTPENMELLANLPKIWELRIYFAYKAQVVEDLLTMQNPKGLRKLSFASQNFRLISHFEDLQSLECVVYHTKDIEFTTHLRSLTELQINNALGIFLWELLKELKVLLNLRCLYLDNTELEFLEVIEVTKINWLTSLRLGLSDKKFIFMLIQFNNLEDLEITSTHHAAKGESNFIISFLKECKNLRTISLYRYYNFLRKDYVNRILNHIRFVECSACLINPRSPPFKLRGVWSDFESLSQVRFLFGNSRLCIFQIHFLFQLDRYNTKYLELENFCNNYQIEDCDEGIEREIV
ncbi:uncharacterized protein [Drosophila takahashii]|uniref:uncharacterized protein n=1 Tax=Drosophila takahashii TaxID=29030 RepID=UPI003898FE88